jgi:integrase
MSNKKIPLFKIILHPDKKKALKNGNLPIVIRVTYKRQRKYFYLGLNGIPENWNYELSMFHKPGKRLSEDEKEGNIQLQKHLLAIKENEVFFSEKEFTFNRFSERFFGAYLKADVLEFFNDIIGQLKSQARIGSALTYSHTLRRLKKFTNNKTFSFADLDEEFIKSFEKFLRENGNRTNTVGLHMRNVRSIYNQAIKKKIAKMENSPFGTYKIGTQKTMKRALTSVEINRLAEYQTKVSGRKLDSINFFFFSYYSFGMNAQDMARLRINNLEGGFIRYSRKKTGTNFKIPINEKLAAIILEYESKSHPFIFPVLDDGMDPISERQRIHGWRKKINEDLHDIALAIDLPSDLTVYWARHSAATMLQRKKLPTAVISQSLGHASEKTTRVYLAGFGDEVMEEAQKLL